MNTKTKLPIEELDQINLEHGAHNSRENGMCAMEALAWLAGRKHSDHPECVCPVIGGFVRSWNDDLRSDADRNRLLRPILPNLLGSKSTAEVEAERARAIFYWLARDATPAALTLAGFADDAALIGSSTSDETLFAALSNAASSARKARDAARYAAWDAARDAAWDAAWNAARYAAGYAARDAAWDAARDAAWDAAWYAAWYAAWNAAWKNKIAPLVAAQQLSAQELLLRLTEIRAT